MAPIAVPLRARSTEYQGLGLIDGRGKDEVAQNVAGCLLTDVHDSDANFDVLGDFCRSAAEVPPGGPDTTDAAYTGPRFPGIGLVETDEKSGAG